MPPSFADRDLVASTLPFRESILEASRPDTATVEVSDNVVGVNAERASAVRDDLTVLGDRTKTPPHLVRRH